MKVNLYVAQGVGDLYLIRDKDLYERVCPNVKGITCAKPFAGDEDVSRAIELGLSESEQIRNGQPVMPMSYLTDEAGGTWDLWDNKDRSTGVGILIQNMVARNPANDVVHDGVVGIDFGTRSTVVACSVPGERDHVLRIDVKDLSSVADARHYEKPTVLEFRGIRAYRERYESKEGRPYTRWEDLTVGFAAFDALNTNHAQEDAASRGRFFNALKQWAAGGRGKLHFCDKHNFSFEIPPYAALSDTDIDPIEFYAYFIGLAINNQQQHRIFLRYLISCPVSFPVELQEKLIKSFEKGLRKSLPMGLQKVECLMREFSVKLGAKEPFAYAISALQQLHIAPDVHFGIPYGVFDFGGGTTDFDFGVWRNPNCNDSSEMLYRRVLEHRHNAGDALLGGENLLECAAFDVYQDNFELMRSNDWHICCPRERNSFPGAEMFIDADSIPGRSNLGQIAEALRPIWERHGHLIKQFEKIKARGVVRVGVLLDSKQNPTLNKELQVDVAKVCDGFKRRIRHAVEAFFTQFDKSFFDWKSATLPRHVFLAGNASRSEIVQDLFDDCAKRYGDKFIVHKPVDGCPLSDNLPTVKTGVALGLLKVTEESNILILDDVGGQGDAPFPYYVGVDDGMGMMALITDGGGRSIGPGVNYGEWFVLMGVGRKSVSILYTTDASAVGGKLASDSPSVSRQKILLPQPPVCDAEERILICCVGPSTLRVCVGRNVEGKWQSVGDDKDVMLGPLGR